MNAKNTFSRMFHIVAWLRCRPATAAVVTAAAMPEDMQQRARKRDER